MPGFDGSGPYGEGRMGRGLGPCGENRTGFRNGRGFGRRGWFGRNRTGAGRFFQSYSPENEIAELEQEKTFLEKRLDELKQLIRKDEE